MKKSKLFVQNFIDCTFCVGMYFNLNQSTESTERRGLASVHVFLEYALKIMRLNLLF